MPDIDLLDIETDRLFEQYTVHEIIEINKKLQTEIDKKRQELRCMVGEKYRDVITAADTIKSMQDSAVKLKTHICKINKKCYEIQSSTTCGKIDSIEIDKWKHFYRSVAIQIKILILIPEYIWTCLDEENYLKAVQLYLLAVHIHTGLELDREHKVSQNFTILARLRLSINSFRSRILDGVKHKLKDIKLTSQEASSNLCAYILLENQTQQSVLKTFIDLRQRSFQSLINLDVSLYSAVRTRILNLINCLICTIDLLHSCFIGTAISHEVLLSNQLQKILSKDAVKIINMVDLEHTPLIEYLPSVVNDFTPLVKEFEKVLNEDIVKSSTKEWLIWISNVLNGELFKSLSIISTVKALHTIREDALKIGLPGDWSQICRDLHLPKNFNVWQHLFQPLVSKRAEELVCCRIKNNLQNIFEKISVSFINEEESKKDLQGYVWNEDFTDLGKDSNNHVGLAMKTKGYSPKIVKLCDLIDKIYFELLQDVTLYLYGTEENAHVNVEHQSEDEKRLEMYLREQSTASIDKLMEHVGNVINKPQNAVDGARLFQAIPCLCPHLKTSCLRGGINQDWDNIYIMLINRSLEFWQQWMKEQLYTINKVASEILLNDIELSKILHILPRWDIIDIEEQTEDTVISSQIRVPKQPSIPLLTLLSFINGELNNVVPHTIPKTVHDQYTEGVVEIIMQYYDKLSNFQVVNQNLALQFLLDVKFLTTICVRRDCKDLIEKSQRISDSLRAKVDPFDLDVFYAHLQNSIRRSVLQSQYLFGCLLASHNQLASLGVLDSSSNNLTDSEPSVVAISIPSGEVWFPQLPVTAPIVKSITSGIQHVPSLSVTRASSGRATSPECRIEKQRKFGAFYKNKRKKKPEEQQLLKGAFETFFESDTSEESCSNVPVTGADSITVDFPVTQIKNENQYPDTPLSSREKEKEAN